MKAKGFEGFKPQGVANTLWALTRGGLAVPDVLRAAVKAMGSALHEFKASELSCVLWALAVGRWQPEGLEVDALRAAAAQVRQILAWMGAVAGVAACVAHPLGHCRALCVLWAVEGLG